MGQGQIIEYGLPGGFADLRAQLRVSQQNLQPLHQFFQAVDRNEPSVAAVMNDFVDPLAPACDRGLATSHRFQINTSEAFVAAGQNKNRAVTHSLSDLGAAASPEKMNPAADVQFSGQIGEAISIRAFSDNLALQAGMRIFQSVEGP